MDDEVRSRSTAFIGNIVRGRKGDGIAAGVAAGGTLSGMGPSLSNLNPRYEAGHMLATFYPLIALLPNGKRFYCETAVHNAATGCLAAGYNEWYSIWDNTAQNGIDQEVIAHAGDAVQTANSLEELAERMGMHIETVKAAFENWDTICDNQRRPRVRHARCSCRSWNRRTTSSATIPCATRAWEA